MRTTELEQGVSETGSKISKGRRHKGNPEREKGLLGALCAGREWLDRKSKDCFEPSESLYL